MKQGTQGRTRRKPIGSVNEKASQQPARSRMRQIAMLTLLIALLFTSPFLQRRITRAVEVGTHLEHGKALLQSGSAGAAEQEWLTAAQLNPNDLNAFHLLGELYLVENRTADSRRVLNHVADLAPSEPHTLCNLALAELRSGMPEIQDAAVKDGVRAARLEPDCVRAQTVAGDALIQKGDTRRGLVYLQRAVHLNPADVPLTLHVIEDEVEANWLPDAARMALDLTKRYPGYSQGYALLGSFYQQYPPGSSEARSARVLLARALSLDPTNALAQARMGHLLVTSGEGREAVSYLEAARLLGYDDTYVLFDLSRAYRMAGRTADAARALNGFRRRSDIQNEISGLEKRAGLEPTNRTILEKLVQLSTALGDRSRLKTYHQRLAAIDGIATSSPPGSGPD